MPCDLLRARFNSRDSPRPVGEWKSSLLFQPNRVMLRSSTTWRSRRHEAGSLTSKNYLWRRLLLCLWPDRSSAADSGRMVIPNGHGSLPFELCEGMSQESQTPMKRHAAALQIWMSAIIALRYRLLRQFATARPTTRMPQFDRSAAALSQPMSDRPRAKSHTTPNPE